MKKRLILTVLIATCISFTTFAQGNKNPSKKAKTENRLDSFALKYGLTDQQKIDFKAAAMSKRTSLKELNGAAIDNQQSIKQRQVIHHRFDSTVKTILTPTQYNGYKADINAKKEKKIEMKMQSRIVNMADSMKIKYDLTTDQHGKVKSALSTLSDNRNAIHAKYENDGANENHKKE